MASLKDAIPTVTKYEERIFLEEGGVIRFDTGLNMDEGWYWNQLIGTHWQERSFSDSESVHKYRTWPSRR